MADYYRGEPAPTGAGVAPELGGLGRPNYELADAASLAHLSSDRLNLDVAIVNPHLGGGSKVISSLLRRAARVSVVAQADVALQPRSGVWRNTTDSVELVGGRGDAAVPFGFVPPRDYVVSVIGCHLQPRSVQIVTGTGTFTPAVSLAKGCGETRTTNSIPLRGRTVVRLAFSPGASVERIEANSVPARLLSGVTPRRARISAPDSSSPKIRDLSSTGLTLADAFNPGWEPSGSTGHHFRTLLGFNGFVLDQPQSLRGLSYSPQRTRDLLLFMSLVSWLAIGLFLVFPAFRHRWLRRPLVIPTPAKLPVAGTAARSGSDSRPAPPRRSELPEPAESNSNAMRLRELQEGVSAAAPSEPFRRGGEKEAPDRTPEELKSALARLREELAPYRKRRRPR
jgi:hypothetical protein